MQVLLLSITCMLVKLLACRCSCTTIMTELHVGTCTCTMSHVSVSVYDACTYTLSIGSCLFLPPALWVTCMYMYSVLCGLCWVYISLLLPLLEYTTRCPQSFLSVSHKTHAETHGATTCTCKCKCKCSYTCTMPYRYLRLTCTCA